MQEKKKPDIIIDVDHIMYSSEPDGTKKTYAEYRIMDSNTMRVYARTSDKDIAELIIKAIKEKFVV